MNYEDFITGSIFSSLIKEDSLPIAGLFLCTSGSIKTMVGSPSETSSTPVEEYEEASNVLSYLLYALDKKQWIKQYHDDEARLMRKLASEAKELEQRERRSHLHIIQGGMSKKGKA